MKITYELDTEKDSQCDIARMSKSLDVTLALNQMSEEIRKWIKYDERESIPKEEILNMFNRILEIYSIDIEEILD